MATPKDDRAGLGSMALNGYDCGSFHQSTTVPGVTSTPISSGRNSSASGSNGGTSSNSSSTAGIGTGGTPTAAGGGNETSAGDGSTIATTPGAPGSSGHKGSIRGNKLARRARSFKDDFLEKISQIRTPTNTMTRSHSPNSPRGSGSGGGAGGAGSCASYGGRKSTSDEPTKPVQDLNYHVRQVKNALTHFKDVILKNKLEMLPGNGTVVLESIANVHTALQSYTLNEHSTAFINATNHVYVSLGNLLKLCDEVLLTKEGDDCPSLSKENVKEVVELVENAINNLVNLANEKISDKPLQASCGGGGVGAGGNGTSSNTLQRPPVDAISQRTSLPDIHLTPRERDILEQTSLKTVRASHSTESILRDSSPPPPPKPPLPNRSNEPPPPLPPKRKGHHAKNHSFHDTTTSTAAATMTMASSSDCCHSADSTFHLHQGSTLGGGGAGGVSGGGGAGGGGSGSIGLDRMSLRSRSPEDNSSLLSASAGSLDSALNHSREEDELRAVNDASMAAGLGMLVPGGGAAWESDSVAISTMTSATATVVGIGGGNGGSNSLIRNSNESGFESMYSQRVSQRDPQLLQQQQYHHQHQQHHHHHQISASSQSSSSSSSYVHKSESFIDSLNEVKVTSKTTEQQQQQKHFHQKIDTIITQATDESASIASAATVTSMSSTSSGSLAKQLQIHHGPSGSIDEAALAGSDDVFPRTSGSLERPPALPVKTRSHSIKKERHPSQYDNVDELDAERSSQDVFSHFPIHSSPTYLSQSRQHMMNNLPSKHISLFEPRHIINPFPEEPPPLPMKKKHMFQSVAYSVMAYMEIFGSATQNNSEFMRHSVHTYNLEHSEQATTSTSSTNHSISHSQTMSLSPSRMASISVSPPGSPNVVMKPPALPPKRQRINSKTPSIISTPPASPKIFQDQQQLHHHHSHQFPQPAGSTINTSPSPSTASLTSSQSGGGNASRSTSSVYNQTLDVRAPKVLQGGWEADASGHSLHGPAVSVGTGDAGPTTVAAVSGPGQHSDASEPGYINRGIEGNTSTNKLAPGAGGGGCGGVGPSKQGGHNEEDYLLLKDYRSSSALIANVSPTANLSHTASQPNLKHTTNSPNSGDGDNSGSTLVISSDGSTKHAHSQYNNGGRSSKLEYGSGLNDSLHNKGSDRHGSSSGGKLALVPSGGTIYESYASTGSDPSARDHDDQNSDKDEVEVEVILRRNNKNGLALMDHQQPQQPLNLMEELDVSSHLVFKKENEDGPDVKGGHPDALIIHATRVQKNSDDECLEDAYGEAFITTFRTFISPLELIQKLSHRYTVYHCQINDAKQKAAKECFSLLVRVVNDLTTPDLSERLLVILMNFDYQLVSAGHLNMAKLLRVKLIEKALVYKQKTSLNVQSISPRSLISSPPTLLDLKSAEIAEQMTLLDAELFQKIEIPEVLIWAQEQCEERSPNLTRFTEHFNKMSYWARTQILSQNDAKDREKHVIKFIKIMKHLRKINNYNSYLALLSALDSAPIRRLEWHKTITEGLKEYCALIDSSSSFRAYRQALAETNPPCIPYIGLVLQDLTFVHIGNPDLLPDGSTNFSKRWQQYHIVVNMKRFRKGSYPFKKNERIIGFFDNFDHYLDEDAMWQISETIKPRGTRKTNVN
ncbi:guanine nucleotide-releasing factor 2 [Anopheles coustani]|uniref:guanine nucleotide-releasing factor 2 n=1 Tax=Anopheles coustani TaxID=139045 RepID=UPI00265B57DB|nr:guanine nucleotide-releasing factor 2 [Anopheles coustani]